MPVELLVELQKIKFMHRDLHSENIVVTWPLSASRVHVPGFGPLVNQVLYVSNVSEFEGLSSLLCLHCHLYHVDSHFRFNAPVLPLFVFAFVFMPQRSEEVQEVTGRGAAKLHRTVQLLAGLKKQATASKRHELVG